ncbi:CDP-glycerol:poly(glycerophosphate) glycerophosphotransferase [Paraglaciecola sp. T6c]|uniref:CDP-glycerol--glycerophosphate glycerophosphotransferase n=1 Tax=Pseudoalteromonas atlantica (strain T6c / ATCC BAA-1087) TaxID=3042615 RepID=UPI00005C68BC|nr:CDP-glycerol--glycerophosphate glycerophosphotransferase [Paraglaciecola sp. T6c]ABG38584.1 CDP-glycerol:poly(glycerophosphate) glycerophosphotransferase [Paraglaciecola sp. T6c]
MAKHYLFYISENYAFQILRPLQDEIQRRGDTVAWFVEGNNVNRAYFKPHETQLPDVQAVIDFHPIAVFVPGNMIPSFIPGLKVCVRHGFIGFKTRKKDGLNYSFIIRDCFDLYCTHGPSMTDTFKLLEQKHQFFKVVETGFCKMDPFFDRSMVAEKDAAANTTAQRDERPVVLFSSTFSPRMSQAEALLPTIKRLSQDTKWRWLVTFHPKMAQSTVDAYKAAQHENLTFIETDNAMPLMLEADLMLGDNSSMLVEFLMLNKPVVTMKNEHPKPHFINVTDAEKIEESIEYALTRPPELMDKLDDYAAQTHPYTDGQSSARIVDATQDMLDNPPKLKNKPFNLIRSIKMRKKLGYWRW